MKFKLEMRPTKGTTKNCTNHLIRSKNILNSNYFYLIPGQNKITSYFTRLIFLNNITTNTSGHSMNYFDSRRNTLYTIWLYWRRIRTSVRLQYWTQQLPICINLYSWIHKYFINKGFHNNNFIKKVLQFRTNHRRHSLFFYIYLNVWGFTTATLWHINKRPLEKNYTCKLNTDTPHYIYNNNNKMILYR